MLRLIAVAAITALVSVTGCARGVDFEPTPGHAHVIDVTNALTEPMIVSLDDGTGERLLGTVAAGATERFIITVASATTVSIVAHDEGRTRTVRRTVTLTPGEAVTVRLD